MGVANAALLELLLGNSVARSLEDNEEVHAEDTGIRVVLHSEIDVLLNTESEAATIRECLLGKFEFLDLESSLQNFLSSVTSESDVGSNFVTSSDAK